MAAPLLRAGVEPGILAGPWETAYGSGQVGIHIVIHTTMWKSVENVESLAVQVYDGVERGWFVAGDGVTSWDGTRLRINGQRSMPSIDLRFHPDKRAWTGTFAARNGAPKTVRLERPRPADHVPGSPLSGVWKSATGDGCLHLAAGSSGTVYAWLDRVVGTERRYGEMLEPQKITAERIVLQLSTAIGPTYEFTGSLGKDGMRIEGQWTPGLAAPTVLVRSSERECSSLPDHGLAK